MRLRGILRAIREHPLVSLVIAGGALRILMLGDKSYWSDEAQSVVVALANGPTETWRSSLSALYEPPLYNSLLNVWMTIWGGTSEFRVRALSWVASVAGLALFARLAMLCLPVSAGRLALGLAAFAPYQILLAQEARMYAVLFSLEMASAVSLVRAVGAGGGRSGGRRAGWWWLAHSASLVLAVATHHLALVWVAAHVLYVVVNREARARWKPFALSEAPAVVLSAVLLLTMRDKIGALLSMRLYPVQELIEMFHNAGVLAGGGMLLLPSARWLLFALCAVLLIFGIRFAPVRGPGRHFALVHLIAPLLVMHVMHRYGAVHMPLLRYAIGVQGAFLLLLAGGIHGFHRPVVRVILVLAVTAMGAVSLARHFGGTVPLYGLIPSKKPLRQVSEFIGRNFKPGDRVVHVALTSALPCRIYLPDVPHPFLLASPAYMTPGGRAVYGEPVSFRVAASGASRVWLVSSPASFRVSPGVPRELSQEIEMWCGTPVRYDFPGVDVYLAPVRDRKREPAGSGR